MTPEEFFSVRREDIKVSYGGSKPTVVRVSFVIQGTRAYGIEKDTDRKVVLALENQQIHDPGLGHFDSIEILE